MPEKPASYYDDVYSDMDAYLSKYRPKECKRTLREAVWGLVGEVNSVLDIGCGPGLLLGEWPEPRPEVMVGLDFAHSAVGHCARKYPNVVWVCADAFGYLQDVRLGDFDAITMTEVLEHTERDRELWALAQGQAQLVVASVPRSDHGDGDEHTDVRYTEDLIRERFGPVEFVDCGDVFHVFCWRRS